MKDKDTFDMLLTEKRLKTYKKWPYKDDTKINKQAVSKRPCNESLLGAPYSV